MMSKFKKWLLATFGKTTIVRYCYNILFKTKFTDSAEYWEKRYFDNGTSGNGSYGDSAVYKATIINQFISDHYIEQVTDLGCGDGNQLQYFKFPRYIGLDVSATALKKCSDLFKADSTKRFVEYNPAAFLSQLKFFKSELVLSLDVIYHLVEAKVFEQYMRHLFACSTRFVIIYAWDVKGKQNFHVKHQEFTKWISRNETAWELKQKIEPQQLPGACDFFIYEKRFTKNTKELSQ
jgi:cyclopropane fatty-acyl-phospholipid synthase-like methyltransferase